MAFATAADIAIGTRAQQVETREDAAIKARYPNAARDGATDPPKGYFDLVTDAQTVLAARAALIGTERRRFAVEVDGVIWFDPRSYAGVRLIDAEQSADLTCMVTRWQVDLDTERTAFELMG